MLLWFSACMKILGALLIAVLLAHFQCEGACLAESFRAERHAATSTEPPCHKHAGAPSDTSQPSHEHNDVCTQGRVLESKLLGSDSRGKVAFQSAATLPAVSPALSQPGITTTRQLIQERPPGIVTSPVPISILRI